MIPFKLERADIWKNTEKQVLFYWINNSKLITACITKYAQFMSNDDFLISLRGMSIRNDRSKHDNINMDSQDWKYID